MATPKPLHPRPGAPLILDIDIEEGSVSVDAFAYTLRFHPTGKGLGSGFSFVATMTRFGNEATIFGGLQAQAGPYTPQVQRAIGAALKKIGIEHVRWDRRNIGTTPRRRTAVIP